MAFSSNKKIYSVQFKEGGSKQVVSGFLNIGEAAGKSRDRLDTVRDILLSMDSAMSIAGRAAGMLQGIFNKLRGPTELAMGFEHQFAQIKTLSSEIGDDLEVELLALAGRVPQTAADVATSAYRAISAGIDPKKVVNFLEKASMAAVAGNATMEEATRALTGTLNSYRAVGLDAERAMDVLFATVKRGDTNFTQLSEALGGVLAQAAAAGVSIEEVGASIATMTKAGITTDEAVIRLSALLKILVLPARQAKKAFSDLGIELRIENLISQGLTGRLEAVMKATHGNIGVISKLTKRKEAASALTMLLSNNMQNYKEDLDATTNSVGALSDASDIMKVTTQAALGRFKATAEGALREIGRRVLPTVVDGLERLGAVIEENGPAIADAVEKIVSTLFSLASWVADHGDLVLQFFAASWGVSAIQGASLAVRGLIPVLGQLTAATGVSTMALQGLAGSLGGALSKAGLVGAAAAAGWIVGSALAEAIGLNAENELDAHIRRVRRKLNEELKAQAREIKRSLKESKNEIDSLLDRGEFDQATERFLTAQQGIERSITKASGEARRAAKEMKSIQGQIDAFAELNPNHSRVEALKKMGEEEFAKLRASQEKKRILQAELDQLSTDFNDRAEAKLIRDEKLTRERQEADELNNQAARRAAALAAAKAHAEEVRRIRKEALSWEIEARKESAERELALLKLKHDEELAEVRRAGRAVAHLIPVLEARQEAERAKIRREWREKAQEDARRAEEEAQRRADERAKFAAGLEDRQQALIKDEGERQLKQMETRHARERALAFKQGRDLLSLVAVQAREQAKLKEDVAKEAAKKEAEGIGEFGANLQSAAAATGGAIDAIGQAMLAFGAKGDTVAKAMAWTKALVSGADALGYGAQAYAAYATGNIWSGTNFTLAAIQSAAASAGYFAAAGSGGSGSSAARPSASASASA
ncbi:phage tail tape measure protein, partial [Myxococcota bacterium]|nr:phage tail tape measure protein [Myxococcota bacterium]